ncbi:hypothetical protein BRD17_10285 [Halobacteriales archaeon SW_7_68_16]|nr:MAG: hypothetical protein BRD17_10285 [Halobacteriales archaeon SW_7_68_16]
MTEGDEFGPVVGRHDRVVPDDDGYRMTGTELTATVEIAPSDGAGRDAVVRVEVRAPTLSATTADAVASVVEDGWYDTFERRVVDAPDVAETDATTVKRVDREGDAVVVAVAIEAWDVATGLDDAAAVADFVEGTYVQGVIPGYEYESPASDLVSRARQNAGAEDDGTGLPPG